MRNLTFFAGRIAVICFNVRGFSKRVLGKCLAAVFAAAVLIGASTPGLGASCPAPTSLGPKPTHLLVVVPGTAQGPHEWQSFLEAFKKDPRSADYDWLVIEHDIRFTTIGTAREYSDYVASCIAQKFDEKNYEKITLIGHSIGGMLIRRAYLQSAGAFLDSPVDTSPWARHVDRILLFASVNRGVQTNFAWWMPYAYWLVRTTPHFQFVWEDMIRGSDFIADIRIAWIRFFGELRNNLGASESGNDRPRPPHIVQFWGTEDSVVTSKDNSDLAAFSGDVLKVVPGATHGNLQRLEPDFTNDPGGRWTTFQRQLFDPPGAADFPKYQPQRVLIVARGIRDSSGSDWVKYFEERGSKDYVQVVAVDYGYMSAAQFASHQVRTRHIPAFRDVYTEILAANPLTEFDFIGHSNGTYIFGHSLLSTPSIRFNHAVLAAPVLPTDFNWNQLFERKQINAVRYDAANEDWPVGILCPLLNALGFSDVGPSGVVLFGEGRMTGSSFVKNVGWYNGNHGAALRYDPDHGIDNRKHLLNFAVAGSDLATDEKLAGDLGTMRTYSRLTKWMTWLVMALAVIWVIQRYRSGKRISLRAIAWAVVVVTAAYIALDVI